MIRSINTRLIGACLVVALVAVACGSSTPRSTPSPTLAPTPAPTVATTPAPTATPLPFAMQPLPTRPALPAGWVDYKETADGYTLAVPNGDGKGQGQYYLTPLSVVAIQYPGQIEGWGVRGWYELRDVSYRTYCEPRIVVSSPPNQAGVTLDGLKDYEIALIMQGASAGTVIMAASEAVFPGGRGYQIHYQKPTSGDGDMFQVPTYRVNEVMITPSGKVWRITAIACGDQVYSALKPAMELLGNYLVPLG